MPPQLRQMQEDSYRVLDIFRRRKSDWINKDWKNWDVPDHRCMVTLEAERKLLERWCMLRAIGDEAAKRIQELLILVYSDALFRKSKNLRWTHQSLRQPPRASGGAAPERRARDVAEDDEDALEEEGETPDYDTLAFGLCSYAFTEAIRASACQASSLDNRLWQRFLRRHLPNALGSHYAGLTGADLPRGSAKIVRRLGDLDGELTDDDAARIALETGVSKEKVQAIYVWYKTVVELDAPVGEEGGDTRGDTEPDFDNDDVVPALEALDHINALKRAQSGMPPGATEGHVRYLSAVLLYFYCADQQKSSGITHRNRSEVCWENVRAWLADSQSFTERYREAYEDYKNQTADSTLLRYLPDPTDQGFLARLWPGKGKNIQGRDAFKVWRSRQRKELHRLGGISDL